MKTYKIIHTETLVGHYYYDADTPEEALQQYYDDVSNGRIDFGDLEMMDSSDEAVEDAERQMFYESCFDEDHRSCGCR